MNRNTITKEEGIVMNSKLYFGDPIPVFSQFTYFLILEDIDWGAQFYYYYRVTDDNYVQIAYGLDDKEHSICAQYQKTNQDLKSNLKKILVSYIEANRFYAGYLTFVKSTIFLEREYSSIIESIENELDETKQQAGQSKTAFIDYLEKNNFNPKPTGNTKYSWEIGCPNADGKHFVMISTLNDGWGCGYCKRKGDLEDFKDWLRELERKKLTQFVKEINTGNKLSYKIKKWWLDRY